MSAERSQSEVEVALDPAAAFAAFTEEFDFWWLRGPINNWDSARVREMRCEAGIGGRLLEVYDDAADDMLELARITAWEPGERLAWRSSVDDVSIDIRFTPTDGGTRVHLTATVAPSGRDAGGSSFIRVTPAWFGRWVDRRDHAARTPQETGRLGLAIHYREPAAAVRWLQRAFGLQPVIEPADEIGDWSEFRMGDAPLIVLRGEAAASAPIHVPWVFVDDLDAHLATAREAGAAIVSEIEQHGYRAYVASDLEGNHWTFAQARPTMA
jgi:hypothetical protein